MTQYPCNFMAQYTGNVIAQYSNTGTLSQEWKDNDQVHSVKSGKTNDLQVFGSKLYKEPK
jgi:hypothetical protein